MDHPKVERVHLSDVEINLEASLTRTRPNGIDGERWDVQMGERYKRMIDEDAFKHYRDNLLRLREELISKIMNSSGAESDQWKMAAKVITMSMQVPAKMIADGESARRTLAGRDEVVA